MVFMLNPQISGYRSAGGGSSLLERPVQVDVADGAD